MSFVDKSLMADVARLDEECVELKRKLARAEEQRDAARKQAERWQIKARRLDVTSGIVLRLASEGLNKDGLLDRRVEAEKQRDAYWEMLCEASDALGGPTPEKAPFVAQHIRNLVKEKATMQSAIDQAVKIVQDAMDNSKTGFAGEDFAFGTLASLLGPLAQQQE